MFPRKARLLLFCLSLSLLTWKTNGQETIALNHVNVIDVVNGAIQSQAIVLVSGNRISEVGTNVKIPVSARVIEAEGKFLIPGLWDMHVHWYDADYLPLFTANGVTGIRIMWGFPMHQEWRKEIDNGKLLGPRMVIASSLLDGPNSIWPGATVVKSGDEARTIVRKVQKDGGDFLKVYGLLSREAFFTIADEAKKTGLPFAGHVPLSVSALEASEAGQKSFEHLTGLLDACSSREEELRSQREALWNNRRRGQRLPNIKDSRPLTRMMLETYDSAKALLLFQKLKQNGTWQCPTLTVLRSNAFLDDPNFRNDPRMKFVPSEFKVRWDPTATFRFREKAKEDYEVAELLYKKQLEIVGALRKAGVDILAGTDVLNPYCFPGFSLHDELELLVQAGLTPLEALQSATVNPARFLGQDKDLGSLEKGKFADFVLLDENPLENIRNTKKIFAVVAAGRLYDRKALDDMLEQAEELAKKK